MTQDVTMLFRAARRASLAAALVGLAATGAAAQEGMAQTRTMSCADVQALVAKRGAVMLATGPNTYDRYVRDNSYCTYPEQVNPEWVPTLNGSCNVGGGTCWDPTTLYGNR